MNKILKGIMKYRATDRATMVEQFKQVKDNPHPKAVFFTCMDSRMIPTRFTETCVGDMFVVRNAGNLIPHSSNYPDEVTTTEPAALELGCVINNIRHVIVCGHSDCKAMNLLYSLRCHNTSSLDNRRLSPLKAWMCAHASTSLEKYKHLLQFGFDTPMVFEAETPQRQFVAYIDPENKFATEDKLSQADGRTLDGDITWSGGGVGRNIADALSKLGTPVHFISAIGKDYFGQFLEKNTLSHLNSLGLVTGKEKTPCCLVVCDKEGDSRLLVGDMRAHQNLNRQTLISRQSEIINSSLVVIDGNVPLDAISYLLDICAQHDIPVLYEPTDLLRASIPFQNLGTRRIAFATPNLCEFIEIAKRLLPPGATSALREESPNEEVLHGIAESLVHLAVNNIILTLGAKGVLIARRGKGSDPFFRQSPGEFRQKLASWDCPPSSRLYKPPTFSACDIVNVSGAGDCFASGFISAMLKGHTEEDCVKIGFKASQAALKSSSTVPDSF